MKHIFKYFAFSSRGITNSEKGIASPPTHPVRVVREKQESNIWKTTAQPYMNEDAYDDN